MQAKTRGQFYQAWNHHVKELVYLVHDKDSLAEYNAVKARLHECNTL